MKPNIGLLDRRIRLIAGGLLLLLAVLFNFYLLAILGVYALLTGFFDWCPVYSIGGYNTLKSRGKKKKLVEDKEGKK